jgi:hypothetical protein
VVVAAGLTVTAVPLFAGILPGVMTPVPLAKTPVSVVFAPTVIVARLALKLLMVGGMELWKLPPNEETAMVRSQQSMSQVFLAFGNTSISILPILGFE